MLNPQCRDGCVCVCGGGVNLHTYVHFDTYIRTYVSGLLCMCGVADI